MSTQRPCIYTINGNNALCFKIFLQGGIRHKTTVPVFQVSANNRFYFHTVTLHINRFYTIVADMHIIHDEHLPEITGVGKDFLVTGHTGVKTDLTGSCSRLAKSSALKNSSVF
jgi:hypothetical protein